MFFVKVIIYGLMPIITTLAAGVVWLVIYYVRYYREGVII